MTCLTRSASTKLYLHVNKSSQAGIGNPRGLSVRGREGKCYKQSACTAGAARMLRAAPRSQRGVKNCISYTAARCKSHNSFSHATRNAYPTRARSHTEGGPRLAGGAVIARVLNLPKWSPLSDTHTPHVKLSRSTTLRAPNFQLDLRLTGGTLTGRLGRVVGKVGRRHTPPRTSFVNEVQ